MSDVRDIMARFAEIMRLLERWIANPDSAEILIHRDAVQALLDAERIRDWKRLDTIATRDHS